MTPGVWEQQVSVYTPLRMRSISSAHSYKLSVSTLKVKMKLLFFHFLFWARTNIFIFSVSVCCDSAVLWHASHLQLFLSYRLRLRLFCVSVGGVCRRAGSAQVSVRRKRHALICDSAVDRGGGGRLLPGPLQTQQTQQGVQGTIIVLNKCNKRSERSKRCFICSDFRSLAPESRVDAEVNQAWDSRLEDVLWMNWKSVFHSLSFCLQRIPFQASCRI